MTAKQMNVAIGMLLAVRFEMIQVSCKVLDVKVSYGELRLKVGPVNGSGEQWISASRVTGVNGLVTSREVRHA